MKYWKIDIEEFNKEKIRKIIGIYPSETENEAINKFCKENKINKDNCNIVVTETFPKNPYLPINTHESNILTKIIDTIRKIFI